MDTKAQTGNVTLLLYRYQYSQDYVPNGLVATINYIIKNILRFKIKYKNQNNFNAKRSPKV